MAGAWLLGASKLMNLKETIDGMEKFHLLPRVEWLLRDLANGTSRETNHGIASNSAQIQQEQPVSIMKWLQIYLGIVKTKKTDDCGISAASNSSAVRGSWNEFWHRAGKTFWVDPVHVQLATGAHVRKTAASHKSMRAIPGSIARSELATTCHCNLVNVFSSLLIDDRCFI